MVNLKAFRNKIINLLANTCTQKVLRAGYLLVPMIITYACLCLYISWSHIPERNITAEVSALGYCSDSSYCNFRINIDAVGMSELTRWRRLRVAAQVRAMFPVFCGISGSTSTSLYVWLKRRTSSRVTSIIGSWSSPAGTVVALNRAMSAAWLTG